MSATDQARRTIDAVFAHYGKTATYNPPTGPSAACTVLLDSSDQEIDGFRAKATVRGNILEVRTSEVSSPVRGATFAIGAQTLRVLDDPRHEDDPERLVWAMTVG